MTLASVFPRALLALWLLALTVLPAADALARTRISAIRLGSHPDNVTRVVMDVSENLNFTTSVQTAPDRIILETGDVDWDDTAAARRSFGVIQGVRFEAGRVLVELKEPALIKTSFTIPPREGLGWRLVVDVQKTTRTAFLAAARPAPSQTAAPMTSSAAAPADSGSGRAIVVYSPQVTPSAPVAAPVAPVKAQPLPAPQPQSPAPIAQAPAVQAPIQPEPVAQPVTLAQPVVEHGPVSQNPVSLSDVPPAKPQRSASGSPMLSAPVPPPLSRPVSLAQPVIETTSAAEPARAADPIRQPQPVVEQATTPLRIPDPAAQPRSPRNEGKAVVVIDPGHGGVDPGALGVSGIYEKHITLAIARELKTQLERSGRYKVHLTRDRDVFIRLRERVAIARQYGADLFISLHADSVANPQLAGLSVYTLSQNASDGEAQALADKENKADLIAGIDLSHESADVANILIDLAQRETMNRSASFASGVVEEVGRETTLLGNTHRFAGFAVLKAPDVPSILVELGYLSNASEEKQLRQPEYRTKLARGIARAVDHYFLEGQKAKR